MVVEVVLESGREAIEYTADELRADRECVLRAVAKGGYALCSYAAQDFRADGDIVLTALAYDAMDHYLLQPQMN